ncbi:DUF3667 domain-containing protein [Flavobacterium sandaracinum]|uniref:DUF3667 domain-containing protein n=1 Tax=Flavobacterium sandaracinum TaxID=2541733 RepID=A0A4V6PFK8_9FLAO|nr:DUF3667 domain-containing protein [Flavobacterium sandaracinum]TDE07808.1 DUF3667 domain-containing protein [Flavobacterium sandaracinum]
MDQNCLNCSTLILNNFCDNCGQKKFKKIDRKYIWDEIQYTFLHTNKGFLYSIKNIIKNPGKTARAFVDGNRVNHYKPILLVFVLSGISTFISIKIIGFEKIMSAFYARETLNSAYMNDVMTALKSYNSILMLLLVPVFALTTKLAFRKWGNNYYEHVVINAYIVCVYTLFNIIIISPLLYIFKNNMDYFTMTSSLSMLSVPLILVWFFKGFYPMRPLKSIIGRVLLTFTCLFILFLLFVVLAIIGGVVYAMIAGPESLEYFKPKQ